MDPAGPHPGRSAAPRSDEARQAAKAALVIGKTGGFRSWPQRLMTEFWGIGILEVPIDAVLEAVGTGGRRVPVAEIGPVTWLPEPGDGGYLADPFGWPGAPRLLLCEQFSRATGQGHISLIDTAEQAGGIQRFPIGLEGHLSYPCLVQDEDGRVFCTPESGASRRFHLVELGLDDDSRPRVIARHLLLQDREVADPTLFRHQGRYWIAFTDGRIGLHDNLCLMVANRIEGPWREHPRNPVKRGRSAARGAGTLFQHAGALFRPAQDCSTSYGAAVALHQVTRCDAERYEEELLGFIIPDEDGPYPDGLHTLSWHEGRFLIDGKRFGFSMPDLARRVTRRLQGTPAS